MIRRWYRRARWVVLGEVAKAVEEYESAADAIAMPVFGCAATMLLWIGTIELGAYTAGGPIVSSAAQFSAAVIAGIFTAQMAVQVCASVVYATQTTELPAGQEVVTRE
jgi:hypothetical protein